MGALRAVTYTRTYYGMLIYSCNFKNSLIFSNIDFGGVRGVGGFESVFEECISGYFRSAADCDAYPLRENGPRFFEKTAEDTRVEIRKKYKLHKYVLILAYYAPVILYYATVRWYP